MKNLICIILFLCLLSDKSNAQKHKWDWGWSAAAGLNFYQLYQQPTGLGTEKRSAGQILNLLPNVEGEIWFGTMRKLYVGLAAGVEYTPFTLDVARFQGLGAYAVPITIRTTIPFAWSKDVGWVAQFGLGAQLQQQNLYAQTSATRSHSNPLYATVIGEVNIGLIARDSRWSALSGVCFFVRTGAAPKGAFSLNTGIKVGLSQLFKRPPLQFYTAH